MTYMWHQKTTYRCQTLHIFTTDLTRMTRNKQETHIQKRWDWVDHGLWWKWTCSLETQWVCYTQLSRRAGELIWVRGLCRGVVSGCTGHHLRSALGKSLSVTWTWLREGLAIAMGVSQLCPWRGHVHVVNDHSYRVTLFPHIEEPFLSLYHVHSGGATQAIKLDNICFYLLSLMIDI